MRYSSIAIVVGAILLVASSALATDDLPIKPVKFGDPLVVPPDPAPDPPPEIEPEEDPRDTPAPILYGEEIFVEGDTIVYVLDVSCSMNEGNSSYQTADGNVTTGSKLDKAKAELARSINGLASNFKFNIVFYQCNIGRWWSSLRDATDPAKSQANAWARSLSAGGSTATGPATAFALQERSNRAVVLLTDGQPNCGAPTLEKHREMIRTANSQAAFISVFGIQVNSEARAFCQGVAADSGGSYIEVP